MEPENFTNYQPQLTQIEVQFRGPLIKDSMVDNLSDLALLDSRYNYQNKMVWVNTLKSYYYLSTGTGTSISDWKIYSNKTVLVAYDQYRPYLTGEQVFQSGKIYVAILDVPIQTPPETNQNYWQIVISDTITYRIVPEIVENQYFIEISIKNPIFDVCLCNIEKNEYNEYIVGSDGLISITNVEKVEADIIQDATNLNKYQIIFYVDSVVYLPTQHDFDIIVNIK